MQKATDTRGPKGAKTTKHQQMQQARKQAAH